MGWGYKLAFLKDVGHILFYVEFSGHACESLFEGSC